MILRAFIFAIWVLGTCVGTVSAQVNNDVQTLDEPLTDTGLFIGGMDVTAWEAFAKLAEGIIEPGTATNFALTRVRAELVPWRDGFYDAQDVNSARLATIDRQLATLISTDESQSFGPAVEARKSTLTALRTRLAEPSALAKEAYARADGLISEIDAQKRSLETKRLTSRSASPANPVYWTDGLVVLVGGVRDGFAEIVATTKVFKSDGRLLSRFLTVFGAILAATYFVFRTRTWLAALARRRSDGTGPVHALSLFGISVARVILPVFGLAILSAILLRSGFFGLIGQAVVSELPLAGALIFYTKWLTDQYFPRGAEMFGILGYDHQTRTNGRRSAVLLGWVLALSAVVVALATTTRATPVSLDVINLPFQLVVGWLMWRLGAIIVHKAVPTSDTLYRRNRVRQIIGRTAQTLAIMGPLASVLGFGAAAQAITIPAVVSLAIVATLVVLQRLSFKVMSRATTIQEPDADELSLTTDQGAGLWPVIVNIIVAFLSLPVFALVWGATTSDMSEVWTRFLAGFSVGGTQISPTSFLTFVMVFSIGYIITGFIKTSLKTSVLPRTQLDLGGQNAIIAGTGYVGVFLSALIGFSVAGIDLSGLAIVAGALSVGIGFGLQNIVSNFVSGIILLIERPVSEGDMIEVGGQMGYVRDISVRSTRIETFDKIDVIIPNADLVSGQVSNWTRGNLVGRAIVAVGVAYGSDTEKVSKILQEIADANPIVVGSPPPAVLLVRFGADSIDFEIRAIIRDVNYVNVAKSEMYHEIVRRFAEEGVEIPFAQRDIWLRNPEALHPKGEVS